MKIHAMRLHADPFEKMVSGRKLFEIRLNDPKRQQIKVGDHIEFSRRSLSTASFKVKVTAIQRYRSFTQLWQAVQLFYPDYDEGSFKKAMHEYYSPEDEKKYGAIVIDFILL